jgi:hypothetical protein
MIPRHVQLRRRQICTQLDSLRHLLQDVYACRVLPGELGPAEFEEQIKQFADDLETELAHLDWLVDCVQELPQP